LEPVKVNVVAPATIPDVGVIVIMVPTTLPVTAADALWDAPSTVTAAAALSVHTGSENVHVIVSVVASAVVTPRVKANDVGVSPAATVLRTAVPSVRAVAGVVVNDGLATKTPVSVVDEQLIVTGPVA
jgi:hypothetical protein